MKFTRSTIEINRELSKLDLFMIDFTNILKKYTSYVIVSGYVAILLGRARASEDIDIIIPRIDYSTFRSLLKELKEKEFYCLNGDDDKYLFEYMLEKIPLRFAKIDTIIPNIELKCSENRFDELSLEKTMLVKLPGGVEVPIPHLELQVAFKEAVLRSPKDLEDALYIRTVAKEIIDEKLIEEYKVKLNEFYRG
ncbi:MAG TPA: hypothetical protein ENI44_04250 [Thermoplasmatales archaeon]|nr:hypothetical protein [Thermoplasmatales archaeon]